jgi:cytochrome d ubiquinol oxidase subunit I
MDAVELARWQFAITTVYHFWSVPISIGLSAIVAGLQTTWLVTKKDEFLRLTKFFGKLLVINFALGVVTGLVQEFQFGLNWSAYSRFVGDVFGIPLALEGLLAFFLESTFLGLWIFGWNRLPKALHLAAIWIVAIGTQLSAYVIIAANSWMQHPVGYAIDGDRVRLTDFGAVLTNSTAISAAMHTAAACFVTGGALVAGISFWHLARNRDEAQTNAFRKSALIGSTVVLVAAFGVIGTGDQQMKLVAEQQPMKLAAAEALFETEQPAAFSLFTVGNLDGTRELWSIKASHILSFLAKGDWNAEIQGINQLQALYAATYGPGSYAPNIPLAFWSFRFMIGFGVLAALLALLGIAITLRRRRWLTNRWVARVALALPVLPLLANSTGWIFRETGRQPWLAFGLFKTEDGVSPGTTVTEVAISLAVFTLLYGALAVAEVMLLKRAARQLPEESPKDEDDLERPMTFAY